jgi:phospholipid N-methyltransferase
MKIFKQTGLPLFMLEGFRKFRQIGSIFPSSSYLGKSVAKLIPPTNDLVVVELGSGTGVITKEILKKLSASSKLLAFENNRGLAEFLRQNIKDPRLIVVRKSAAEINQHLAFLGFEKADYIISGLPLGTFKQSDRAHILSSAKDALKDGGKYIQFQYFLWSIFYIKKFFTKLKIKKYELRNIPPAFVYECQK